MLNELNSRRRLRLFISAYACSPFQGSEAGVGWGFVSHLAAFHDLDVVVEEEKFRDEILAWIKVHPEHPASRVRFHFVRKNRNRFLRKIWPPSYYWYYREWQLKVEKIARNLDLVHNFDILHQLTMVGFREPGYLWRIGKPFVWGPVGGVGGVPTRFLCNMGLFGFLYYSAYNLLNSFQIRFLRRPRLAARSAGKGLIVATSENFHAAHTFWKQDGTVLSEVGTSGFGRQTFTTRRRGDPLRIVWSGKHIPGKALILALEALSRLHEKHRWELHILGQGKLTSKWKSVAKTLGVADSCVFYGKVPRDEALSIAASCHVALITSLRDLTSSVTIESLELGLPVIAPKHCGFADVITDNCGILIPVTNPKRFVKQTAMALETLARDEVLRAKLAQGALERAQDYNWEIKVNELNAIYEAKLAEEADTRISGRTA